MSPTHTIGLVALRELRERAVKKGYILGTVATIAVVVAAIVLPTVLAGDGPEELTLGVVGQAPGDLDTSLLATLPAETELSVVEVADRASAFAAVDDGELDAALVERRELLAEREPDAALRAGLEAALQLEAVTDNLRAEGLSDQQAVGALRAPPPLQVTDVAGGETGGTFLIAALATVLLFVGVQMSGASLLSGALEEKTNRVVEVLVSTARPWQLLTGKVLAINLLTFLQVVLITGAGLAANAMVDAYPLPTATGVVLGVSGAMLVAGLLFYAALFTVAGTLASTVEDAQSTAGPLYLAMFGAYGAVFATVLPNPSGIVSQVLTFLPPTAPFVVPARVALGEIAAWQVPVSIGITVLGALLALKLAGRIYASSLLAGGRLTWSAAWRAEPVR